MTKRDWVGWCLELPGTYEDYPFDDDPTIPGAWTCMRLCQNKKIFAFLYERQGKLCANLKCEPLAAGLLRGAYQSVKPGYHMNKDHWITVELDGDVPTGEIQAFIRQSYDLVKPKRKAPAK